jgi:hypothetical protein
MSRPAIIAYGMVSIWLTEVKDGRRKFDVKKPASPCEAGFSSKAACSGQSLLAILLDSGGAQSRKTVLVNRKLPGQEFVDRQGVAAASLLKGEQAAANRGNDFGLTANNPPFGPGRGQIRNC